MTEAPTLVARNLPAALLVTRNFPPLTGGMERLTFQSYQALRKQFAVSVCGPKGASKYVFETDRVTESNLSPLPRFLLSLQFRALQTALAQKPQIIHAGSGLATPAAWMAARATGAKVTAFVHGLDLVADNRLYQSLFLPAIRRCDMVFANSHHTLALAQQQGIPTEKLVLLHPGVALPDIGERSALRRSFRREHNLGDAFLLLSVGRLTARKGLPDFIRHALPEIVEKLPNTILLVIGEEPQGALKHTLGVREEAMQAAIISKLEAHVRFIGKVDDAMLKAAYFAADAHIFPVLDLPGDVEGFGMVALEAAAHGLPTIAFASGGVPDAVLDGTTGRLVEPGNYAAISEAIVQTLRTPYSDEQVQDCHHHAAQFTWPCFEERFLKLLQKLPNKV